MEYESGRNLFRSNYEWNKSRFKKVNSFYKFFKNNTEIGVEGKVVWFDFSHPAIDGIGYDIFFLLCIEDKLLQSSFGCPIEEKQQWFPYMLESMLTIRKNKEN